MASDARVSRSLVASVDRGELNGVTIGSLVRIAAALGADIDVRLRWRGEQLDRLLDEDHAAIVQSVVARLRRVGWLVEVEVSFAIWGERGSVDVLAFHPPSGCLLVVEVKSVVPDAQLTLHGLDRKARLARAIVKDRPWKVRSVSRLLVVGASLTSRRRIARLAVIWDVTLPARGPDVRRWLVAPTGSIAGILFASNDSHAGTRRPLTGRERVRRRIHAPVTATTTVDRNPSPRVAAVVDTASVAVE